MFDASMHCLRNCLAAKGSRLAQKHPSMPQTAYSASSLVTGTAQRPRCAVKLVH